LTTSLPGTRRMAKVQAENNSVDHLPDSLR
jgi:hypothetical protein